MIDVPAPPAEYAVPYRGIVIEKVIPMPHVNIVCRILGIDQIGGWIAGCAISKFGACFIVLPKVEHQWTQADQDAIRAHELAHCNGWRH
jgi:hypothetical protein